MLVSLYFNSQQRSSTRISLFHGGFGIHSLEPEYSRNPKLHFMFIPRWLWIYGVGRTPCLFVTAVITFAYHKSHKMFTNETREEVQSSGKSIWPEAVVLSSPFSWDQKLLPSGKKSTLIWGSGRPQLQVLAMDKRLTRDLLSNYRTQTFQTLH